MKKENVMKIGEVKVFIEDVIGDYAVILIANNDIGCKTKILLTKEQMKKIFRTINGNDEVNIKQSSCINGIHVKYRKYTKSMEESSIPCKYQSSKEGTMFIECLGGFCIMSIMIKEEYKSTQHCVSTAFNIQNELPKLLKLSKIINFIGGRNQ